MELMNANRQWANRPIDERFASVETMHAACVASRENAGEASARWAELRALPTETGGINLMGPTGAEMQPTHWAFGQLAAKVGAPGDYLRSLPAPLACHALNHGLRTADGEALAYAQAGDTPTLRAITSDKYTRIYNADITARLLPLSAAGWRPPIARPVRENTPGTRPATADDCGAWTYVKPGELIAPAGLYASDRNLFAFLIHTDRQIRDGSADGLFRGFFVENSEVGAASLRLTAFLFRAVCGNHIVWDAQGVSTVAIRHVGVADRKFGRMFEAEIRRYMDQTGGQDEQRIQCAQRVQLGGTKDEVLDRIFGKLETPRAALAAAYGLADDHSDQDGSPRTLWGMAQGLTRYSQTLAHADARTRIDRQAGKLLSLAW